MKGRNVTFTLSEVRVYITHKYTAKKEVLNFLIF